MSDQGPDQWLTVSFSCPEVILEPVVDLLGVWSGSGVEQAPVEGGRSLVTGFYHLHRDTDRKQVQAELLEQMAALFALYELPLPEADCAYINDEDWATSWKQFFKPFAIIPGLVIKPSWEPYKAAAEEQVIEIDPGMAFGTGKHASTRLALALIHDCFQNGRPTPVLDVGTGTGILAMAAALFGAQEVIAVDNDPEAVRVAIENIGHNNLQQTIHTSATDLADISGRFELVCANIVHNVLAVMAPDFGRLLAPGGRLVLAGILRGEQEKNIIAVCGQQGITLEQAAYEDEWAGLLLKLTR